MAGLKNCAARSNATKIFLRTVTEIRLLRPGCASDSWIADRDAVEPRGDNDAERAGAAFRKNDVGHDDIELTQRLDESDDELRNVDDILYREITADLSRHNRPHRHPFRIRSWA